MLHNPSLLILDEPASGLDPRARIEFRELLKELAAAGKSILISSHILSELSETCDGILVIEKGSKVVSGDIESIAQDVREHHAIGMRLLSDAEAGVRFLTLQPHVQDLVADGQLLQFDFTGDLNELADLLQRSIAEGHRVVDFRQQDTNLEDIFLRTTHGRLQ